MSEVEKWSDDSFRIAERKLEFSHDVPYLLGQITALTSENKRLRKELQQYERGLKTSPLDSSRPGR
jgi:hypothetical protein